MLVTVRKGRVFGGWSYNDAQLRETLVEGLERREERLFETRTLWGKGLEDLSVEVEHYQTRQQISLNPTMHDT